MFKFKLEFLLRYRSQKENLAMNELAGAVRAAHEIESELEALKRQAGAMNQALSEVTCQETVNASVLCLYKDYQDHLRFCDRETLIKLGRAEEEVETCRLKLVEAGVERKTIERYKEKKKEEYEIEDARREQKELDELVSLAQSRREYEKE